MDGKITPRMALNRLLKHCDAHLILGAIGGRDDRTSPHHLSLGRFSSRDTSRSRFPEKRFPFREAFPTIRHGLLARSPWVVMMMAQADGSGFCVK